MLVQCGGSSSIEKSRYAMTGGKYGTVMEFCLLAGMEEHSTIFCGIHNIFDRTYIERPFKV